MTKEQCFEYGCHTCAAGILSRYEGDTTEKMIQGLLSEFIEAARKENAKCENAREAVDIVNYVAENAQLESQFEQVEKSFSCTKI